MSGFTPGELLALYAILTTSRAPGAPALAQKVHQQYRNAPRGTARGALEEVRIAGLLDMPVEPPERVDPRFWEEDDV